MDTQQLPIRKFVFLNENGRKQGGKHHSLKDLTLMANFTDLELENVCILPVGEMLIGSIDSWSIRRVK
jgi:hypothetical protein